MAVIIPIVQYAMLAYEAYSLYETLTAKPQLPANQISDLSVQTSDWGTGIPQIYGVQRVAGNIVWSTAKTLVDGTQGKFGGKGGGGGGGKGGGGKGKKGTGSQGYYVAAVAFSLCEGPVAGIKRIWAGGQLIFDDSAPVYVPSMNQNEPQGTYVQFETVNQPIESSGGSSLGPWTLYHGTGLQNPDPTIVSNGSGLGTNGVPYQTVDNQNGNVYTYGSPQFGKQGTACGYRGLAYIIFPRLNLGYGGTMPQLTFEVVGKQTTLVFDATAITQPFTPFPSANGATVGATIADGQFLYVGYAPSGVIGNVCINLTTNQFISLFKGNVGGNACNVVQQWGSEVLFFNYDIFDAKIPNSPAVPVAITNEDPYAAFVLNGIAWALVAESSAWIWLCSPSFVSGGGNGTLPTTNFYKYGTAIVSYSPQACYTNGQVPVLNNVAYMSYQTTLVTFDGDSFTTVPTNLTSNIQNLFTDGTTLYAACFDGSNQAICNIFTLAMNGQATPYMTISSSHNFLFATTRGFFFANGYLFTNTYCISNGQAVLAKINSDGSLRYSVSNTDGNLDSIDAMAHFIPFGSGIVGINNYGYTIFSFGDTEIIPSAPTIASTITDICNRAGLTSIDVSLLPATPVQLTRKAGIAARDILKALCQVYLIDMVDSAGTLRFVPKGQNISAQIGIEEVGFADVAQGQVPGAPYSLTRSQGFDLPRSVTIEYTSALIQFNRYAQQFQILFPEGKDVKTSVPLTLGDTQALNVAEFLCTSPHIEKNAYAWTLSFKWLQLEPGDVIQMPWGVTRITQVTIKDGQKNPIIEYQGVIDASYVLNGGYGNAQAVPVQVLGQIDAPVVVLPPTSGGNFISSNVQGGGAGAFVPVQPALVVGNAYANYLEVPPIISSQTAPFYLIAPYSSGNSFVGAQVWESTDGGVTFDQLAEQSNPGVVGFVQQALTNTQSATWDTQSVVSVYLNASYMQLSSATDIQVIQGANLALVGNELIQFANANLMVDANGVSYYQISRLLRGRRGTEWAMGTQVGQDSFTIISKTIDTAVPYALTNLNNDAEFKIVTVGQDISAVSATNFAPTGVWFNPFSPVGLQVTKDSSNNWNLSFIPRARLNGWWVSGVAPTLDPDTQNWSMDIYNGTTFKRTVSGILATPSFQYTASMQTSDGFSAGAHGIIMKVYEVGQLGRGTVATITT